MIEKIINRLQRELPATVKLVAVSKFHPFEAIEEAYHAGQRIFAESRPQELVAKIRRLEEKRQEMIAQAEQEGGDRSAAESYMSDIQWHFIGHLQTNKLKMVLPYVDLVHSVDSVRLLDAIQSWASANDRMINVLLEPHVAAEESKQGFAAEEIHEILAKAADGAWSNVSFKGLMGMATFTEDEEVIRQDFSLIRKIFDDCREKYPALAADFTQLSIGMSDDYPIAIEYGSTMVRIGSMIFGERQ